MDAQFLAQYYTQQIQAQIPEAKFSKGKTQYIWVKNPDGSLVQKEITIGNSDGINVEVVNGLSQGEVMVGLQSASQQARISANGSSSPFMPTPPKRNNSRSTQNQPPSR